MCIAIYKSEGTTITKRVLKQCWTENPQGAGFMFADDGKLIVEKGYFTFRTFYQAFRRYEIAYDTDFVLHFRIATSGKVDYAMCHPFNVNDNLAFVHNGTFSGTGTKEKSDTAIFCEDVLKNMPDGFLRSKGCISLLEHYCTDNFSKLIFLDNQGEHTIIGESAGVWDNDVWFSYDLSGKKFGFTDDKYDNDGCADNILYNECDCCGIAFPKNELYNIEGGYFCRYCADYPESEKEYEVCDYCNKMKRKNDIIYMDGGSVCVECEGKIYA